MKVYFLKNDVSQYVIFPTPENPEDYFVIEVENEDELDKRSAIVFHSKLILVEKQPSPRHEWDGQQWTIKEAQQQAMLKNEKARLLRKISDQTDRLKTQYLQGYSQAEIDSFYRQEREARGELPLMLLTELFEGRNDLTSIEQLKEKVIEKADLFAIIMGKTFAIKQGFEVRIEQATTMEALDKIDGEIEQWQSI